jgi:hypothetical protein
MSGHWAERISIIVGVFGALAVFLTTPQGRDSAFGVLLLGHPDPQKVEAANKRKTRDKIISWFGMGLVIVAAIVQFLILG